MQENERAKKVHLEVPLLVAHLRTEINLENEEEDSVLPLKATNEEKASEALQDDNEQVQGSDG